jgi:hypothetical protein
MCPTIWTRPRAILIGAGISLVLLSLALGLSTGKLSLPQISLFRHNASTPSGSGPRATAARRGSKPSRSHRRFITYYVSPEGRDSNRGSSPAHPWRTVARVDRAHLVAGDHVLFQGGSTFSDNTLMPGLGFEDSGASRDPIVFGSYGSGKATLTRGVWLGVNQSYPHGPSHLVFENLSLGPKEGFQGTGNYITLRHLTISGLLAAQTNSQVGISTEGSHWWIEDNTITDTGDSGMLLGFDSGRPGDPAGGEDYVVSGNVVSHTGLNPRLTYGLHAIYLKVANARISGNQLTYFRNDGISMRYRDAVVSHNYIAHGDIGIAWYQYDALPGKTRLIANTIAFTSTAAIFVCGVAQSCKRPIESFVLSHNRLTSIQGAAMNLQPTAGSYVLQANQDLQGHSLAPATVG